MEKLLTGQNVVGHPSNKIFVTSQLFRHFCPTKFCLINYSSPSVVRLRKTLCQFTHKCRHVQGDPKLPPPVPSQKE